MAGRESTEQSCVKVRCSHLLQQAAEQRPTAKITCRGCEASLVWKKSSLASMNQLQEEPEAPAPPELIRRDPETGREGAEEKANPTDNHIPNHQTAEIS